MSGNEGRRIAAETNNRDAISIIVRRATSVRLWRGRVV
jgi:hypothetical protein